MPREQAKATVVDRVYGTALVRSDDSAGTRTKVNRKTLMWCAIGLGAAIVIPAFIYLAPHFL